MMIIWFIYIAPVCQQDFGDAVFILGIRDQLSKIVKRWNS